MIKFFRKIRQNLLSEGKTGKYFKYAIGEIILVVIGILIALSINNWNESKKSSRIELEFLKNLNRDLDIDLVNFENKISIDSSIMSSNKKIMLAIQNHDEEALNKSFSGNRNGLSAINRAGIFYPQKSAYESLKSQGIQLISNDSLRQKIINLYDYRYQTISDFLKFQWDMLSQTNPYLFENLETNIDGETKRPNDINQLFKDKQFYNFVSHMYSENLIALDFYRPCLEDLKSVSATLKQEIRTLEK